DERPCRTRVETRLARSALIERGCIGLERQAADDLRQKQPRAAIRIDHTRVPSDPAESRVLRVYALLHRTRINVGAGIEPVAAPLAHPLDKRVHPALDHLVVVLTPGIPRDERA